MSLNCLRLISMRFFSVSIYSDNKFCVYSVVETARLSRGSRPSPDHDQVVLIWTWTRPGHSWLQTCFLFTYNYIHFNYIVFINIHTWMQKNLLSGWSGERGAFQWTANVPFGLKMYLCMCVCVCVCLCMYVCLRMCLCVFLYLRVATWL